MLSQTLLARNLTFDYVVMKLFFNDAIVLFVG